MLVIGPLRGRCVVGSAFVTEATIPLDLAGKNTSSDTTLVTRTHEYLPLEHRLNASNPRICRTCLGSSVALEHDWANVGDVNRRPAVSARRAARRGRHGRELGACPPSAPRLRHRALCRRFGGLARARLRLWHSELV